METIESLKQEILRLGFKLVDGNVFDSPVAYTFILNKPGIDASIPMFHLEYSLKCRLKRSVRLIKLSGQKVECQISKSDEQRLFFPIKELMDGPEWEKAVSTMTLPVPLGVDTKNNKVYVDLAALPNLFMGGATMQGKSVLCENIVAAIHSARPDVDLTLLKPLGLQDRHICDICKVYEEPEACIRTIQALARELRSPLPSDAPITPSKVIVADDFYELYHPGNQELLRMLETIAALGPIIGVYIVGACQRTAGIRALAMHIRKSFPAIACFRTPDGKESKELLGADGAQYLRGKGDMLLRTGKTIVRLQTPMPFNFKNQ